jgi:3-hydroxypropanoate dehydrogenase
VTQLDLSPADLATLEAQLGSLALDPSAQDLLFLQAQTANDFTDAPVSDAQTRAIYDLIKWGPTGMNSQPLRIVLVRSPEARERLVQHMAPGNQARTLAAPLVAVLATDLDFHNEFHRTFPVFPGARDAYADEEPRTRAAYTSALLQAGYFIVGVRAAGLAAGPMGGYDADAIEREFFPDGRHRVLLVVNLGQPSDQAFRPRQPRLDYEDVVTAV